MLVGTWLAIVALTAVALVACERDPCANGQVRTARSAELTEEWCERDGVRDGYYKAASHTQTVTGQFRRGVRTGEWWWLPRELGPPTRFMRYDDDGSPRGEGGYLRGERHGRWVSYTQGFGPDPAQWYKASDLEYRCGRIVGGTMYSVTGEAKPAPVDPPAPAPCP